MSIESEINRINTNVQNTLAAIEEMGGEVPEDGNSDDMAGGVKTIPVGAKIDDATPSASTTYSSEKIEAGFSEQKEANAAQDKLIRDKLDANKLPEAVNSALEQAKASGEFDGKDGQPGKSPTVTTSKSGKTTTITITDANGVKTATINDGEDGAPGTPGTSVIVSGVTESTEDGGSNVVTFSDGKSVTIKNGKKGSNGEPGKTPVKGTDYWTAADQESVVQQVIAALGTPVFGRVDENNNIILTGELANGTYIVKYEDADGELVEIGTLDNIPAPTYTNVLPLAKGEDGNPYNGTGYAVGKRINSSWNETNVHNTSATNPVFLTGRIPIPAGATVRLKNCYIDTNGVNGTPNDTADGNYYGGGLSSLYGCMLYYNATSGTGVNSGNNYTWDKFVNYSNLASKPTVDGNGYVTEFTFNTTQTLYARFVLGGDPTKAIITINEPITD